MRARGALVVGWLALGACRSPTQIAVTVRTDVPCTEVTSTAFTSGKLGAIEGNPPTTESASCRGDHLGTVVLVPSDEDNAEVGFKVVTALHGATIDHCSGATAANDESCIVSRRELRFLPHTMLDVIVDMTKACEGRICDPSSTCVEGVCKSATIADPSQCTGAGCDESVLGASDAGVDATIADGAVDATIDATVDDGAVDDGPTISDAPVDADANADTGADAGADTGPPPSAVPGCDLAGLQAGAAWPMEQYCPSGRNRALLAGPTATPTHKWTYDGGIMPSPSVGADGTVYVADNAAVLALDPASGAPRWRYSAFGDASSYANLPVIAADDTLRLFEFNSGTYAAVALDASAGTPVSIGFSTRGGVTIAGDGTLYFPSNVGRIVALNANGTERWDVFGDSNDFVLPAIAADGTIFSADGITGVYALHPDGGSRWSVALDAGAVSNVSVAVDGTLRVFSALGRLYKVDASSGAVIWSQLVDPSGIVGIAVADDGTTYVGASQSLTSWSPQGAQTGVASFGCNQPTIDAVGDVYAVCGDELTMFDRALTTREWHVPIPNKATLSFAFEGVVIGPGHRVYTTITDNVAAGAIDAFGP